MKKLVLLLVLFAHQIFAQSHVMWSWESKKISDCEYDLVFKAEIDKYYHIFSIVPSGDNRPTTFSFTPSVDYTLVGKMKEPKPHRIDDEIMGITLEHESGRTLFTQEDKVTL